MAQTQKTAEKGITTKFSNYKVSFKTGLYLDLLRKERALYSDFYNAFIKIHADEGEDKAAEYASNIMTRNFDAKFDEIEKNLIGWLSDSISDNITVYNDEDII